MQIILNQSEKRFVSRLMKNGPKSIGYRYRNEFEYKTKFEPYHHKLKFISTSKQKYNLKFQEFETVQSPNE